MQRKIKNKIQQIILETGFIAQFALDDFKAKYAGSMLGVLWAFLQPMITILLYWFIFQLGFRTGAVLEYPFILWLVSGLIPWFFISEAIPNATASLAEYSYLVKKVLFNINILPITKVVSVLFVQIFLLLFAVVLFAVYGYMPDMYYLQLIFYLLYAAIFVCGLVYLTATLYVFFKDTVQLISVVMQIIFWTTPIVWNLEIMPQKIQTILKLNPVYYVIDGYRSTFIYKKWFWEQSMGMTIYYWILVFGILYIGLKVFGKCKDHFADVL